jgi:hypothetical protein
VVFWLKLGGLDLERVLKKSRKEIRDIARMGKAKLTVAIVKSERLPSLQIPPSMSAFVGFVNAVIDIDHLQ